MAQPKKKETIFHVELLKKGTHHYFGSISAIFSVFTIEELKVKPKRLYDFNVEPGKPYRNKECVIRKSVLHRNSGNRKSPFKHDDSVDEN